MKAEVMNETPTPKTCETSLTELLSRVPIEANWTQKIGDDWKAGVISYPVGSLCKSASERIRQLYHELAKMKDERDALKKELAEAKKELAHVSDMGCQRAVMAEQQRDAARAEIDKWKLRLAQEEDECVTARAEAAKWRECAELFYEQYKAGTHGRMLDKDSLGLRARERYHELCSPTPSSPQSQPTAPASAAPETETASRLREFAPLLEQAPQVIAFLSALLSTLKGLVEELCKIEPRVAMPTASTSTSPPTPKPSGSAGDASA